MTQLEAILSLTTVGLGLILASIVVRRIKRWARGSGRVWRDTWR